MSPVQLQVVDCGMSRDTMTKLTSEPCALYVYMLSMSVQVVSNASLLGVITSWFVALPCMHTSFTSSSPRLSVSVGTLTGA